MIGCFRDRPGVRQQVIANAKRLPENFIPPPLKFIAEKVNKASLEWAALIARIYVSQSFNMFKMWWKGQDLQALWPIRWKFVGSSTESAGQYNSTNLILPKIFQNGRYASSSLAQWMVSLKKAIAIPLIGRATGILPTGKAAAILPIGKAAVILPIGKAAVILSTGKAAAILPTGIIIVIRRKECDWKHAT